MNTRNVEGVSYYRFVIRYTLIDGRRRRMIRWSPGFPWVREEVARELDDRFGIDAIKPGSVSIQHADLVRAPVRGFSPVKLHLVQGARARRKR